MGLSTKLSKTPAEAIARAGIQTGHTLLIGGFGLCGIPMACLNAIAKLPPSINNLTVVSNNGGVADYGLGVLLRQPGRIGTMVASYIGGNRDLEAAYLSGNIHLRLMPQGTLAEALRAGGAGIPAFYTPTGAGTIVELGGFPVVYDRDGNVSVTSELKEAREFVHPLTKRPQRFILEKVCLYLPDIHRGDSL